ncbi:hypothetical protein AB0D37_42830 [Streptomyces sp. NPDC048384]|uniref:hypothetical protein n=1 Tax=Streptomyces sp. NPDC048384 TaxID=3155487 RepID=UPI003413ED56
MGTSTSPTASLASGGAATNVRIQGESMVIRLFPHLVRQVIRGVSAIGSAFDADTAASPQHHQLSRSRRDLIRHIHHPQLAVPLPQS